jgi:hypothetical protein
VHNQDVPLEVLFGIETFSTLRAYDLRLPIVNYAVLFESEAIREHLMTENNNQKLMNY